MASIMAGGIVATIAVLLIGILISVQPFFQAPKPAAVLLTFSIVNDENMPTWCKDLASLLHKRNTAAAVFLSGKIAEENPDCVRSFDSNVDIGSSTYSYVKLTQEADYSVQLNEVNLGKKAVDEAANLDSRSFKAPGGETDENIYSLLSRSGILADFSYKDRYHKYHGDQFIWFNIEVQELATSGGQIPDIPLREGEVTQINIDNTSPIDGVNFLLDQLTNKRADFVNASEVTGLQLTIRRDV